MTGVVVDPWGSPPKNDSSLLDATGIVKMIVSLAAVACIFFGFLLFCCYFCWSFDGVVVVL